MTGKRYYITTLGAWRAHAPRFANSHFILLDAPPAASTAAEADAPQAPPTASASASGEGNCSPAHAPDGPNKHTSDDAAPILVLIEADEGAHLALEDEPAFEALPHPLAQKADFASGTGCARRAWRSAWRYHLRCRRGCRADSSAAAPPRLLGRAQATGISAPCRFFGSCCGRWLR